MFDHLYQLHETTLFFLVCVFAIIISIVSVSLVHRYIPINLRYKENSVIGNMSALISIIYGVLAGLMALYLINGVNNSSDAIQREANAVANIYRVSKWLPGPEQRLMQSEVKGYLHHVIDIEWPQMRVGGEVNHEGDVYIGNMSQILKKYRSVSSADAVVIQNLLEEFRSLYNAREYRIAASADELSWEIWIVILVGTVLTVLINYLFGMHLFLHMLTASAATLMAFSMVFLLVTLDRPFQGEYVLEPDVFKPLLASIEQDLSKPS